MSMHRKFITHFLSCVFVLTAVSSHGSESAQKHKDNGNRFFKNHQYVQAIEAFTKAIEDDPDFAAAYYNRGRVYYDMELYYKAIVDFDMAIMMNPDDKDAYYARGLSYSNVDKLKLALADVEKASDLGHTGAKQLLNSGALLKKMELSKSKQKKISAILDVGETPGKRTIEMIDVDNEFGGNTIQTIYSKGDPLFDGSDGIYRQLDYYDGNDMLKKTEQYHTASFIEGNNRNKTTIFYTDDLLIAKKVFSYTGKLLNYKGVYEYDAQGKLKKQSLLDKFGQEVSKQKLP